jgi:hypothetical protein
MKDELGARRWKANDNPNAHKPVDALRRMIEDIEAGKHDPTHIAIVFIEPDETIGWYQAGSATAWAQVGLLFGAAQAMSGQD